MNTAAIRRMVCGDSGSYSPHGLRGMRKCQRCLTDTALRDISALLRRRVLEQNEGGGRSTSYRLGVAELVRE